MADSNGQVSALSELQELVELARCVLHRTEGSHIIVIERDFWQPGENGVGEARPFLKPFPDTEQGYIAAKSAILRRYPQLITEPIVCASCGQAKPADQFDSRFLGKPVKKYCRECRNGPILTPEQIQERALAERRKEAEFRRKQRAYEERFPAHYFQFLNCVNTRQLDETAKRLEADEAKVEQWKESCRSQGFNDRDIRRIAELHRILSASKASWQEVRAELLALNPPYLGKVERPKTRLTPTQRKTLYDWQQGKCAYCQVEMLPLNYRDLPQLWSHFDDIPDFMGSVPKDGMVVLDRERIPEVEHRLPASRGGTDDLENLCFACRSCNALKGIRTPEEFKAMPKDPISRLCLDPAWTVNGLIFEQRGYSRFDDAEAQAATKLMSRFDHSLPRSQAERGE